VRKFHHNTAGEVEGYVERALAIIESANPPEDLRVAAFTAAINLLSSKQVIIEESDMTAVSVPAGVLSRLQ
jgi:hypothetical protein